MKNKSTIKIENYFELFLLLSLIILFLFLIKDYLMSIFLASIMVFFTYKFYIKLSKKINKYISAFFIVFLVLTIIILPIYILSSSLINQSYQTINSGINLVDKFDFNSNCNYNFCSIIKKNIGFIDLSLDKITIRISQFILNSYSSIFNSISIIILNLFIFILSFYYLLVDGDKLILYLKRIIPMKSEYKNALFLKFRDISESIFINIILIAIIQGFLLGFGFWIFSIPNPIFWGVISSFFALLPMIGTAFIWIPALIYLFLTNSILMTFLFFLYSIFIISLSDNLLAPFLLKNKIKVHPFLILLTILGGIQIFGFFGLFIGPIIISLLISILKLYNLDFD